MVNTKRISVIEKKALERLHSHNLLEMAFEIHLKDSPKERAEINEMFESDNPKLRLKLAAKIHKHKTHFRHLGMMLCTGMLQEAESTLVNSEWKDSDWFVAKSRWEDYLAIQPEHDEIAKSFVMAMLHSDHTLG